MLSPFFSFYLGFAADFSLILDLDRLSSLTFFSDFLSIGLSTLFSAD
jgi:hypothetical protein